MIGLQGCVLVTPWLRAFQYIWLTLKHFKGIFRLDASTPIWRLQFRRLQKCIHTERVESLRTHSGYTIHCYSIARVLIWISKPVHGIDSYLNPNLYNPHDILSIPIKRICIKIVFKCPHHGYWCKSGSETVMIVRCGHGYSVIIVGIRNKATTSDWLISLSRFSNASIIARIPTHAAVAALWRDRSECSDWLTCVVSCYTPANWRWRVQSE